MTSDGVHHQGVPDLPRLTSVRAFAALVVFGYHAYLFTPTRPARLFEAGYAGVGLFFVLSGFVLTWATRPETGAPAFYWRRFARIYPAYLVALGFAAVVNGVSNGYSVLSSVALVQAWLPPTGSELNPPSWSLSCEALFYLAFPLLVVRLRGCRPRVAVWAVLGWWALTNLVTVVLVLRTNESPTVYQQPVLRSGEFVLGIVLALAMQRGWRPPVRTWHAVALLAVAVVPASLVVEPLGDVVLGLPFALLLVCLAADDLRAARGWMASSWLVFAGKVSFAFYLVHQTVLVEVARHAVGQVATAVGLVLSIVAALLLHVAVEVPAQRWLTRKRRSDPADLTAPSHPPV